MTFHHVAKCFGVTEECKMIMWQKLSFINLVILQFVTEKKNCTNSLQIRITNKKKYKKLKNTNAETLTEIN